MLEKITLVDLTHPLTQDIPTWSGSCGFHLEIKKDYDQIFRVEQIKMHGGAGTHMDAPCHRFEGGLSIGEISLDNCLVPLAIIDVSQRADATYQISKEDIAEYEKNYGKIVEKSLVIGYTGWDRFWNEPVAYRNIDEKGMMQFPSFSLAAAELLVARKISGLGIDTLSPDTPRSSFPVHHLILGEGLYIIENVANASKMPPTGSYALVMPIKAMGSAEAPIRLVGLNFPVP